MRREDYQIRGASEIIRRFAPPGFDPWESAYIRGERNLFAVSSDSYCGFCACAGAFGVCPEVGVCPVAGFAAVPGLATGFFFTTGFLAGSLSSTTIFFGGTSGIES